MVHYAPLKILHIVTGPPGAGKTTWCANLNPDLEVFDTDLGNKQEWRKSKESCILITAGPSSPIKEYWYREAKRLGFYPKLITIWVDRWVAYDRMKARSGLRPGERNDLERNIELWYKMYSRHRMEQRIDNG